MRRQQARKRCESPLGKFFGLGGEFTDFFLGRSMSRSFLGAFASTFRQEVAHQLASSPQNSFRSYPKLYTASRSEETTPVSIGQA